MRQQILWKRSENQVNENLEKLVELQEELTSAKKDLKDAEAAVSDNHDNRYNGSLLLYSLS